MLTPAEKLLVEELGLIWNRFLALPNEHPNEQPEFCQAIHLCQNMILARPGRREINPELTAPRFDWT